MAAGITFKIGGVLDPSYGGALAQSVIAAKAATLQIERAQNVLRNKLTHPANQPYIDPAGIGTANFLTITKQAEALELKKTAILINANAERNAIEAKFQAYRLKQYAAFAAVGQTANAKTLVVESEVAAERVAIERAADIAIVESRIAAAAAGASAGMGGHGRGGMTGIIRESLVIMREAMMGRGGPRIAGSATLLAQYLGLLNTAVKSTAAPALAAAAAAEALAIKLDLEAAAAVGTALETEALNAAKTQQIVVTEAQTAANRALLTSVVTLNPVFLVTVGILVAVGTAAFFLWRHFSNLAVAAKNLADALNPLKQKYTELAVEQDKAAKAAKENADWIKDLNNKHESESHALERKIKLLKEEQAARRRMMESRGASDAELQSLDRANLEQEKAMLLVQQARLKAENDTAQAAERAASTAAIAGTTGVDEKGRVINFDQAQTNAKKRGEILDAAQDAMDEENAKRKALADANPAAAYPGGFGGQMAGQFAPLKETDIISFKVGGKDFTMTVAEAKKNFEFMSAQAKKLATDQAALDDVLKDTKSTAREKMDAQNRVNEDLEAVNAEIGIANTSPKSRRGGGGRSATERERVGIGAPQVANLQMQTLTVHRESLNVAKQHLKVSEKLASQISNLRRIGLTEPQISAFAENNPDGW